MARTPAALLTFADPPADAPEAGPPLRGRRVALRPTVPDDYPYLFRLATDPQISFRWRLRSATPSYEAFVASLFQGVLVQYVVAEPGSEHPLGLVALYNADFRNQIAYLAVLVDPAVQRTPMCLDALVLFLHQAFTAWDLRKIYAETTDLSYASFASGEDRIFRVEGTYPEHERFAGRAWTMYMLAFYRSSWQQLVPQLLPRALGEPHLPEVDG